MKFTCRLEDQVEVRPVMRSDSTALFHMLDDNRNDFRDAFPWLDDIASVSEVETFIARAKQLARDNHGLWCLILQAATPIGLIAVTHIDWRNSHCALGYGLVPAHRQQGLLSRACRAVLDYCFTELELHRVEVYVETFNTRGRAVPERLGFIQEGMRKEAYAARDGFSDLVVYRMLEEEWRQQSRPPP